MKNTNNNFSFKGKTRISTTISPIKEMKILQQFPISKANGSYCDHKKYFEINLSMIKKNFSKQTLNKFSAKGGRSIESHWSIEHQTFQNTVASKTEASCKVKFKGIWSLSGVNAVSKGRQCSAKHCVQTKGALGTIDKEKYYCLTLYICKLSSEKG